jgi:hypothetical protein
MSAVGALLAGVLSGFVAGIVWLLCDLLIGLSLHSLALGARTQSLFDDWVTPIIGLGIALASGYVTARVVRNRPMVAASGVALGLLAVFFFPQTLIRSDVSMYLAGPGMFVPTILGLVIFPLLGGRFGRRIT